MCVRTKRNATLLTLPVGRAVQQSLSSSFDPQTLRSEQDWSTETAFLQESVKVAALQPGIVEMARSFRGVLWSNFMRVQGLPLAIILSILLWLMSPKEMVPFLWILPLLVFCIIATPTFLLAAYESFGMSKHILPRVLLAKEAPRYLGREARPLCLLESSELFSHDSLVSFYCVREEGYEELIGIGSVLNIQEDGKVQVIMSKIIDGHEDEVTRLMANESTALKSTRVKPNVPKTFLMAFQ